MPRAYYRPFTAYEEAVGFKGARRNAYLCCAFLFGGLLFKVAMMLRYSTVVSSNIPDALESDPRYQALLEKRLSLSQDLSSQESMKRAMLARRSAPPA